MRPIHFIPLALLGACAAYAPALSAHPTSVAYRDLALESREARAELRQRVAAASRQYCSRHGRDITPDVFRLDKNYCPGIVRASIVDAMPAGVRHAYALALREGGVAAWQL